MVKFQSQISGTKEKFRLQGDSKELKHSREAYCWRVLTVKTQRAKVLN